MAKKKTADPIVSAIPAAEGVRFEFGTATACAVRNEARDITVRVRQQNRFFRNLLDSLPIVRGIIRLFGSFSGLFSALNESADLKPRSAIRGSSFTRAFAHLFSTSPVSILSILSAIAIPVILAAFMIGLPMGAEILLAQIEDLPRFAVNAVCCMFRMLGALLSVYAICRLRVINRLCMYRGAACKVLNAYEAYGEDATHESAVLSPRLSDKSDGAFLIVVMLLSIAAFACVRTENIVLQLGYRVGSILLIAGFVNELIRPLERANPNSRLAVLRRPLIGLQHLFTIEPHNQMIEVALCAFRAACDNDMSRED